MSDDLLLRLPALEIVQGSHLIYAFAVDGKQLPEFAAVSRVHRDSASTLGGYQRPEVQSHIRAIRRYLESPGSMLPNAIVLAFDGRVEFEPLGERSTPYAQHGHLVIPVASSLADEEKPAFVVDGQQRSAAIRDADLPSFPMAAVGFIAASDEEQRSQFILVNSTKPLPKGLIHELLPETTAQLPARYARRRLPAYLMIRLNSDVDSPFLHRIAMPTQPAGYIKDNSVLKMIENSLFEGALYQYRDPMTGEGDVEQMLLHIKNFWKEVAESFPEAWSLPPTKSRLTHGAGIQALGFVMDAMTEGVSAAELPALDLDAVMMRIDAVAAWTTGTWVLGPSDERRWNGIQNTPNDVRLLTYHFLHAIRT